MEKFSKPALKRALKKTKYCGTVRGMKESQLARLDLRAPLFYDKAPGLSPFGAAFTQNEGGEEFLFCFELDSEQAGRIDPTAENFLGEPVFAGRGPAGGGAAGEIRLPAGLYLFAQKRGRPGKEECAGMAIEQQKDGLWERIRLDNRLYVRFLREDGGAVTQLFRPYAP